MTIIPSPDELAKLKAGKARHMAEQLFTVDLVDLWSDDDVIEYLTADGYFLLDGDWRTDTDVDLVAAL